ncbi:hypothetical protein GCM10023340_37070 [Nocardioides marinquilinus]|uniref:FTP domain-containing protein n=1 Tax=Nocardioides marinquilinus TaxID=1210400 RepID=A0ABP9Q111_9ACTN
MTPSSTRRLRLAAVAAAGLALLAPGLATATAGSAPSAAPPAAADPRPGPTVKAGGTAVAGSSREVLANYDSRTAPTTQAQARRSATVLRSRGDEVAALAERIGGDAEVALDPATGTLSQVASRTGFLTAPSGRPAAKVALDFVRANRAGFGLSTADLGSLRRVRQVTDLNGITHVFWQQVVDGSPVFGNGLRAHVDRQGRLIAVQGSPVAGVQRLASRSAAPRLDARAALRAAVDDARTPGATAGPDATAERVWFAGSGGLRAAWLTYTTPGAAQGFQHVVDATTGRVLFRRSTVNFESDPGTRPGDALVHENYPGAGGKDVSGGQPHVVNLYKLGYLPRSATWMRGRWASVWADLNDDNQVQPREKTAVPGGAKQPQFPLHRFKTAKNQATCKARYQCTWNPNKRYSWKRNMDQDGVQGLYLTSKYAQWLRRPPFGFTPSLGNFERSGGDAVNVHTIDGADTANGLPDGNHVNNANFNTPPDGTPPTMQMYLNRDGYLAASSTNAFDNIGHEYTHGLSNRLVVDSSGASTLNSYQGGGMGEGWSDFYSFDYLVTKGFMKNRPKVSGELMYDRYLSKNRTYTRSQAIDCKIGQRARLCLQVDGDGNVVGKGGYTYGDINGILGTEVHSAGEVWAQTLWAIHERLGHEVTMRLVTSAMTLSPDDPSMLDMRDAIITADKVIYGKKHTALLWKRFAARGFGFYAASIDGADPQPAEDFHVPPPASAPRGAVTGVVRDGNGDPVAGAVVFIAGHTSGALGTYSDVTGGDGRFRITDVVAGRYPKMVAMADGHEGATTGVTVRRGATTAKSFELRRDWAASSGGAEIASYTGPDYTPFGCGPGGAIDLSRGTGWGSETTADGTPATSEGDVEPKSIVIALPQAVDITSFGVDPSATCGDPGSASTGEYRIETGTSATGPWTEAASGEFTPDDQGRMVELAAVAPGTTHVRFTMLSPQVPDFAQCPDAFAGCTYMDLTEVAVYDDGTSMR